jgi:RNA polymerase sigma-70 factor (ECF subfamily)
LVSHSEASGLSVEGIELLACGDLDALRRVYRQHHVAVRAFALRLLGDEDVAEDLVQEVFLALPSAASRYRGEGALSSYLLGIAARRVHKHVRAAARRRRATARLAAQPLEQGRTPEQELAAVQAVRRLMTALDTLPDKLRVAFVLCQIEERDATEVGAILRVPASTVRARLQSARQRLQRLDWPEREQRSRP